MYFLRPWPLSLGMLTLKNEVLDQVLLRRTKDTRAEDIQLPPRIVKVRMDSLDTFEEDFYEAMYTQSQAQFNTYVDAGTVLNNYAHIFDILIRLRQVVDHPYLVLHSASKPLAVGGIRYGDNGVPKTLAEVDGDGDGDGDRGLSEDDDDDEGRGEGGGESGGAKRQRRSARHVSGTPSSDRAGCKETEGNDTDNEDEEDGQLCGFCQEPPCSPVHAHCTHVFCESCVTDYLQLLESDIPHLPCPSLTTPVASLDSASTPSACCPVCSEALSLVFAQHRKGGTGMGPAEESVYLPRTFANSRRALSKKNFVNKLDLSNFQSSTKLEALMQELHMMRERDYGAKAIVFSQFVNMLDVS